MLWTYPEPAIFWVVARGFVTPSLVREDLARAEAFGRLHPEGWSYVVDTRRVRGLHPANLASLRRIPGLPGRPRYIVIAPRGPVRAVLRLARRWVPVDTVVGSREEALRIALGVRRSGERDGLPGMVRPDRSGD